MATTSMDTIIQEWLGTFRSIETRRSYRYDMQKFKRWMTSNRISFHHIQLRDLQQWQRTMGDAPADRRFISSVKSFFRYCFNQDYLSSNIGRCLRTPKRNQIRIERTLSKEQIHQMIALAGGKDVLLMKLLFYLGLRLSEVRQLKRKDITNKHGQLEFCIVGKGNKRRTVSLSRNLSREIVRELPRHGYLFHGRGGKGYLSRTQAYRRVKRIMSQVIPEASPHWLRHGFCSISLSEGASVANVSKAMGHSSVATTSGYMHATGASISSFLE